MKATANIVISGTTFAVNTINQEVLEKFSGPELVDAYNQLAEKVIKKFDSKQIGMQRILKLLNASAEEHVAEVQQATESVAEPVQEPIVETPAPARRGRPKAGETRTPKLVKDKKISKEARLVHLFIKNPNVEISRGRIKSVIEGIAEGPELDAIKKSSYACYMSFLRNPDCGFGLQIVKGENGGLIYNPEKNKPNWPDRKDHVMKLVKLVEDHLSKQ